MLGRQARGTHRTDAHHILPNMGGMIRHKRRIGYRGDSHEKVNESRINSQREGIQVQSTRVGVRLLLEQLHR